jgi:hypothetical protein
VFCFFLIKIIIIAYYLPHKKQFLQYSLKKCESMRGNRQQPHANSSSRVLLFFAVLIFSASIVLLIFTDKTGKTINQNQEYMSLLEYDVGLGITFANCTNSSGVPPDSLCYPPLNYYYVCSDNGGVYICNTTSWSFVDQFSVSAGPSGPMGPTGKINSRRLLIFSF